MRSWASFFEASCNNCGIDEELDEDGGGAGNFFFKFEIKGLVDLMRSTFSIDESALHSEHDDREQAESKRNI